MTRALTPALSIEYSSQYQVQYSNQIPLFNSLIIITTVNMIDIHEISADNKRF